MKTPARFQRGRAMLDAMFGKSNSPALPTSYPVDWWQRGFKRTSYGTNGIVYACINVLSQTLATCGLQNYKIGADGGFRYLADTPILRTLRRPNEFQTKSDYLLNLGHALFGTGNAYTLIAGRDRLNNPTRLYLVDPRSTRPMRLTNSETGAVEIFYSVGSSIWTPNATGGERATMIPARDMIHIRLHTPDDPLIGVTPIQYVSAAVATNDAINAHQAAFFENMRRPSGVLTTDLELKANQMAELRAAWDAQSEKMNAGGVPILAGGFKWQQLAITSQDSQLVEAQRLSIEDISRAFRVPLAFINAGDGALAGNAEALGKWFLASGLGFYLDHVEGAFERAFDIPSGERFNFDTSVLMRSNDEQRISTLAQAVIGGIYSPNEARAREGLPAALGGDSPRVQQQVVPLEAWRELLAPEPAAPALPGPAEVESEKAVSEMFERIQKEMRKA